MSDRNVWCRCKDKLAFSGDEQDGHATHTARVCRLEVGDTTPLDPWPERWDYAQERCAELLERSRVLQGLGERIAKWVTGRFGVANMARQERAARLVEEVIELAQAEGLPLLYALRIAERVYSRPAGEARQEAGGVGMTWLAWCRAAGEDPVGVVRAEVERVEALPDEHFRRRQAEKVAAGTAMEAAQ